MMVVSGCDCGLGMIGDDAKLECLWRGEGTSKQVLSYGSVEYTGYVEMFFDYYKLLKNQELTVRYF